MTMIPKPEVSLISSYFPSLNGHRLYPVSRYPALEKPPKKLENFELILADFPFG
jgi:hypothetical protein